MRSIRQSWGDAAPFGGNGVVVVSTENQCSSSKNGGPGRRQRRQRQRRRFCCRCCSSTSELSFIFYGLHLRSDFKQIHVTLYQSWSRILTQSFSITLQAYVVWPDLANFRHFGKISPFWQNLQSLGIFWGSIWYLAKFLAYFGIFCILLGKFSLMSLGQMLKNNLAIWSHWLQAWIFCPQKCALLPRGVLKVKNVFCWLPISPKSTNLPRVRH